MVREMMFLSRRGKGVSVIFEDWKLIGCIVWISLRIEEERRMLLLGSQWERALDFRLDCYDTDIFNLVVAVSLGTMAVCGSRNRCLSGHNLQYT